MKKQQSVGRSCNNEIISSSLEQRPKKTTMRLCFLFSNTGLGRGYKYNIQISKSTPPSTHINISAIISIKRQKTNLQHVLQQKLSSIQNRSRKHAAPHTIRPSGRWKTRTPRMAVTRQGVSPRVRIRATQR